MSLPPPINWLQKQMTVEYNFPQPVNSTLMLFHADDFFEDDEEIINIIRSCVVYDWGVSPQYKGIIRESDRKMVQLFMEVNENLSQDQNWIWITDTLMTVCDKTEFIDQSDEKDVRFWMMVQNYRLEPSNSVQQYNRKGRCHIIIIETKHLGNWDPVPRENLEISGFPNQLEGDVFEFDLPRWIYEVGKD